MKNVIKRLLGIDLLENNVLTMKRENLKLRDLLSMSNETQNNIQAAVNDLAEMDWNEIARDEFNYSDLAEAIDLEGLVDNIDTSDIAYNVDIQDLASYIDTQSVADEFDLEEVLEKSEINIDNIAEQVVERIKEREGLQHMLVDNVSDMSTEPGVNTDSVQSMIDNAIQQFADSLEVMVSAKINY